MKISLTTLLCLSLPTFFRTVASRDEGRTRWTRSRRQVNSPTTSSSTSTTTSASSTIIVPPAPTTVPTSPPSPVPTPMDLSVSYSVSTSCLAYITSILSSDEFSSCLPFSLLLSTSSSYAVQVKSSLASGDLTHLNSLLAYTVAPAPGDQQCDAYFAGIWSDVMQKSHCQADIKAGKNLAVEFLDGVGNYQLMRQAAGLKDPKTDNYCYLEELASNQSDDLYLWSLPAGVGLPSDFQPTCSKCSALLLEQYSIFNNATTLNSTLIESVVQTVDAKCGPSYATFTATPATGGATATSRPLISSLTLSMLIALILVMR